MKVDAETGHVTEIAQIKAFVEKTGKVPVELLSAFPSLTLFGFKEGQTEADLSNEGLAVVDAKLIARDLRAGLDLSDQGLEVEDAIIIAECIKVSASMTSLK